MKQIKRLQLLQYLLNFRATDKLSNFFQIIKTLESCRFYDQIIEEFECFCRTRNYKSLAKNFKTMGNFKIVSITSNNFQALF